MADTAVISNPQVVINNVAVAIVPNSLDFTEGFGEQKQRVQSAGGGSVSVAYADNVESHFSKVKFKILNTAGNIALARSWKTNANANAITISSPSSTDSNGMSRSFSNCALISDYEVGLGVDSVLDLEFHCSAAV
jgi:hypothetical protein